MILQHTQKHILLLVCSDDYRKVIELAIKMRTDWQVASANSVIEGLTIAEKAEFDAVLLDSTFAEADLDQLLERYPCVRVPIIVFVEGRAVDWHSLIEQGAAGVVSKMDNLLDLPKQVAELMQW